MLPLLTRSFDDRSADLRGRIAGIYGLLIIANIGVWAWALYVFRYQPVLLGTALLAYGFGLRHAVDADHIAAIDNVTRKLMQDGKRPVSVGFYFALGHSTVVLCGLMIKHLRTQRKDLNNINTGRPPPRRGTTPNRPVVRPPSRSSHNGSLPHRSRRSN